LFFFTGFLADYGIIIDSVSSHKKNGRFPDNPTLPRKHHFTIFGFVGLGCPGKPVKKSTCDNVRNIDPSNNACSARGVTINGTNYYAAYEIADFRAK
jgi:hypothetical protein